MITFKDATLKDCPFVARGICMALHLVPNEEKLKGIAKICEREDVLYSYRHTIIAWDDDVPVGICLCYDGGKYHEMRMRTFPLFEILFEGDTDNEALDLDNAEDEASEGEYYMDSLAVMPEWRQRGIGFGLIEAQMEKARQLGFAKATLLVDPANDKAQGLYRRVGFVEDSEVYAFGQIYWKWQKNLLFK